MKPKYYVGQRLSFIARSEFAVNGNRVLDKLTYHVGYVKQVRRRFFGVRYVMIVAKSDEIHIVPPRDILGTVEKRDNLTKSDKSNDNGNI